MSESLPFIPFFLADDAHEISEFMALGADVFCVIILVRTAALRYPFAFVTGCFSY